MTDLRALTEPTAGVWTECATNAQLDAQVASASAAGTEPFAIAVKANIAVRGFVHSAASPALESLVAAADAPVVAALRVKGAVVVGTTNMHELAFGITSQNPAFGNVAVPGHPDASAGGSSGGSAAAVASGAVRYALATDTGGSVSIPASHCGVVGFRPSTGRWPGGGLVGLSWSRDTVGVIADTVRAVAEVDSLVTGEVSGAVSAAKPRIGVPEEFTENLAPESGAAFDRVRAALSPYVDLVPVSVSPVLARTGSAAAVIVGWEAPRLLGLAAAEACGLDPRTALQELVETVASDDVRALLNHLTSDPVSEDAYAAAVHEMFLARQTAAAMYREHRLHALLFPTTPAPAPSIAVGDTVMHNGASASTFSLYTRNTEPGTILGAPMVTVPVNVPEGALPVGVTFQGPRGGDRQVLDIAARLAAAVGPTTND